MQFDFDQPDFDLDDETLRRTGSVKWTYPPAGVIPAWVAEMDVAPCPVVSAALADAVARGAFGYPTVDATNGLPEATAGFLRERFGWAVDPGRIVGTGDVMQGILVVLESLCEPGPVVIPVPSYPPFLLGVPLTGREVVPVPMHPPTGDLGYRFDLERIDAALRAGARTVLIANPHNPTGRVFSRPELEELRDVVRRHGARVISDEIHSPLVLSEGLAHTPYASLEGTSGHVTTVAAASKAWNLAGLKCAQIVHGSDRDAARFATLPPVANHGVSPLGIIASNAAYSGGGPWLAGLLAHLRARREQLGALLAEHLPAVRWHAPEATYLAWLDARETGHADPAGRALTEGGVMVNPGPTFGAPYDGFVRLNYATSPERLERVVLGLAKAWA